MTRLARLALLLALTLPPLIRAAAVDPLLTPDHRIEAGDPAWRDLLAQMEQRPDAEAGFEERRWFPFKKLPTLLKGEVRVSTARGLSLHYTEPDERIVIIDERGLLLRAAGRDSTPPSDPRATAVNTALLHLLRFDLRALAGTFEIFGERTGAAWTLALVPRDESLRRTLGTIAVAGEAAVVRRIEMRRSATQRVEILVGPPRLPPTAFTAEDQSRYFR